MPKSTITSGLPDAPNGMPDRETNMLSPLYRAINNLSQALGRYTGNVTYSQSELDNLSPLVQAQLSRLEIINAVADVAIGYGKFVNLFISSGALKCRLADATLGRPAHGVCNNPTGRTAGQTTSVVMAGATAGISGATAGIRYWLTTAGSLATSPPGAAGNLEQVVGFGLGSLGFYVNISQQYTTT